jgi:Tfp pilus assembly PilM family ATPase
MTSHKDSICGIEIRKNLIIMAQYSPDENAVGSIVIKPITETGEEDQDAQLRGEFKKLISEIELKRRRIVLSLPSELAVIKKISLDSDESSPEDVISWEISQNIIGSIEDYSVDFEPLGQNGDVRQYLAVAYRKSSIKKFVSLLKTNKLNPWIVDLDIFALINVFEANYAEIIASPVLLVLAGEEKTLVIITQAGMLVDFDVFAYPEAVSPDDYSSRLDEYRHNLCGNFVPDVLGPYCAGPLFMHPEFTEAVSKKLPGALQLDPFKKIICHAAREENSMGQFAPQLAVAVGLAIRGRNE